MIDVDQLMLGFAALTVLQFGCLPVFRTSTTASFAYSAALRAARTNAQET
jgi:hypothetical protein